MKSLNEEYKAVTFNIPTLSLIGRVKVRNVNKMFGIGTEKFV